MEPGQVWEYRHKGRRASGRPRNKWSEQFWNRKMFKVNPLEMLLIAYDVTVEQKRNSPHIYSPYQFYKMNLIG